MTSMPSAGLVILVCVLVLALDSLVDYRRGHPSARGRLLGLSALTVYGVLGLAGVTPGATGLGAAAVWSLVAVAWAGFFLSIRDRRKARSAR